MELTPGDIHDRLAWLARKDRKRKVFGAATHHYRLNPPLDVDVIKAFEAEHGIVLPEDYRRFITEIGNGGAGPFYGLFPFGYDDDGPWRVGVRLGDVGKPFLLSEAWNLDDAFWANELRPPEGTSVEEEDRLWEEWDKVMDDCYWNPAVVNGAIPICHLGCALRQWLVVHGNQRGFVWTDYRADSAGLFPLRDAAGNQMTFGDWYRAWLDDPDMKMPER